MDAVVGEYGNSGENREFKQLRKTWRAKTALLASLFLILGVGAALGVDGSVARWFQEPKTASWPGVFPQHGGEASGPGVQSPRSKVPGELKRLLTWSEGFGHGLGVLLVSLLIYQLEPANRRRLARAVCMALASGLTADGMKMLVSRTRPRAFDLSQPILESFTGFLPGLSGGSAGQSFPSAHVATAVGWALGLGWLYPRGRWIFIFLAFLVVCQRLETNAHFLSDCLAGAAVGCLVGSLFLPGGWLSRGFERWEGSANPLLLPSTSLH